MVETRSWKCLHCKHRVWQPIEGAEIPLCKLTDYIAVESFHCEKFEFKPIYKGELRCRKLS